MMEDKTICPHCGSRMKKWRTPDFSTWSAEFFFVCFNDDCPYFTRGWNQMQATVAASVSYRYRYDPATGYTGPIPVWSKDALKSGIIED
ncbi:MAG: ogr/Delta-like zinc finger family protein [Desulfacinum sp.]|jgi:uncharacterized protein CbrC (UPF0167 family)|nr:ogr/Delta-like zinc finger family protein [Desulfacinum sp.]